jgi:hypothetical protein
MNECGRKTLDTLVEQLTGVAQTISTIKENVKTANVKK